MVQIQTSFICRLYVSRFSDAIPPKASHKHKVLPKQRLPFIILVHNAEGFEGFCSGESLEPKMNQKLGAA